MSIPSDLKVGDKIWVVDHDEGDVGPGYCRYTIEEVCGTCYWTSRRLNPRCWFNDPDAFATEVEAAEDCLKQYDEIREELYRRVDELRAVVRTESARNPKPRDVSP